MKLLKVIVIILAVIIVVLFGALIFANPAHSPTAPTHPAVVSPDGNIAVSSPAANALITSPVAITGYAVGPWYFEASFPIKVLDGDGTVLGQGPAQAQSDWMTTGTVPFGATISFAAPKYGTGTILFHNDNPSGDHARDKEFRFPVRFK